MTISGTKENNGVKKGEYISLQSSHTRSYKRNSFTKKKMSAFFSGEKKENNLILPQTFEMNLISKKVF